MAKKKQAKPVFHWPEISVESTELSLGAKIALYGVFYALPLGFGLIGLIAMLVRD